MASKAEAARANGRKGGRPKGSKKKTAETPAAAAAVTSAPAQAIAPPIENAHGLTPRELLFVAAYTGVALGNASKSYELAGYSGRGGAQRTNACKMLTKDHIAAAISERLALRVERLSVMDGDEALERISVLARGEIGLVLGPHDVLSKLPLEARMLIKSVRDTKHGRHIELYDALRASEIMAKAGGKLTPKTDELIEAIGQIVDELHP